jgi:hypothetical protein
MPRGVPISGRRNVPRGVIKRRRRVPYNRNRDWKLKPDTVVYGEPSDEELDRRALKILPKPE